MLRPSADVPHPAPTWVGRACPRREDEALLRGQGRYLADLAPPGCLHAAFARSAMAHAHIALTNLAAVQAMPGVRLVLTGEDLQHLGHLAINPLFAGVRAFDTPVLARQRVLCVGMPVALVVAATAAQARDAAEALAIDYTALPASTQAGPALAAAPLLEGWPDNTAFTQRHAAGDLAQAAAQAAAEVRVRIACPPVAPMALEPRGFLAHWQDGRLTAWTPLQSPHRARLELARVLGLAPEQVRTIAPDVGGAFGGKASLGPEEVALAACALRLAAPVRWVATREEDFVSAPQGRAGTIAARAFFAADGRLLGLGAELLYALGCRSTWSTPVPTLNAARMLPGPYRCDAVDIVARGVATNTAAVGIYRGAGRPEAALVMEGLMDAAARRLGLDPVALRRRNLVPASAMPWTTPTGQRLDSGDYAGLLDAACALARLPALRAEQARRRAAGDCVGIGINLYVEPCGSGWESARLTRWPGGRVTLASGSSAQGQGHATAFAQIAADALGIAPSAIDVVEGDSDLAPAGIGALASRSMAIGGSAVLRAAQALRGLPAADTPVSVEIVHTAQAEAWSAGCCIVLASVDPLTGTVRAERAFWVDDAGTVVNPLLFEGQMHGGFAQGLGQALMERMHYDGQGQLLSGSLMDYAVPRADDMPPLVHQSRPSRTDANPLGAKGVGESGCIAAPAALRGAVLDALAPLGVTHLDLPLTPLAVWQALQHTTTGDTPC
ncbi:xanthine dehydrogenase family protein molybdopterin-binding subunit [Pseudorhodoferax sp.]|uniref:xanthine dehydrogenase family protein molybdopterin-binding subunit n=1 Tax=Pseudorhodoferax sp. TaxID=1993553 RepID=UPI002DD62DEB|nr:xanthine dehydrogenase family protein molybdopterin-binding subunit [Pseudorhodoferax sp.]